MVRIFLSAPPPPLQNKKVVPLSILHSNGIISYFVQIRQKDIKRIVSPPPSSRKEEHTALHIYVGRLYVTQLVCRPLAMY